MQSSQQYPWQWPSSCKLQSHHCALCLLACLTYSPRFSLLSICRVLLVFYWYWSRWTCPGWGLWGTGIPTVMTLLLPKVTCSRGGWFTLQLTWETGFKCSLLSSYCTWADKLCRAAGECTGTEICATWCFIRVHTALVLAKVKPGMDGWVMGIHQQAPTEKWLMGVTSQGCEWQERSVKEHKMLGAERKTQRLGEIDGGVSLTFVICRIFFSRRMRKRAEPGGTPPAHRQIAFLCSATPKMTELEVLR